MLARLIAIVLALAGHHGHHDTDRLTRVAEDIWHTAEHHPVFCGAPSTDAAQYATALALAGIATHESAFHPAVQSCTYNPRDPAVSLFALQGPVALDGWPRARVCADNALAANLAAGVLSRFRRVGSLLTMAQGYASGNTATKSRAAREIADLIATLLWRERIFVAFRNSCLTAEYLTP